MCTGKGYVGRELLSLHLRERGVLIQGSLYSPLKSGGFFGTFGCTGKGYIGREGGTYSGLALLASQKWCFFWHFGCTGMGYIGRKLLLLHSGERGVLTEGSLCSPLKSGGFFGTFGCTSKGYVGRELLLLCSRERRALIQG